jgi:DNA-directed RNA polymerase beta subunit
MESIKNLFVKSLTEKIGIGETDKLLDMYYKFIDGSTKKILIDRGNQTTLGKIYAYDMVPLINQRSNSNKRDVNDLSNSRVRMGEIVVGTVYKQFQQALSKFKKEKSLSKAKIIMPKDYIINELIGAGVLQYCKTLNPLEEIMLSMRVTKAGLGNEKKSMMSINKRDLNKSYFGTIAPTATNEYGGIGVSQTLTNAAKFKDKYGSIIQKDFDNESNPFENFSPVESLSAFFEYDDTTRRIMGNQQTGQFTQIKNPDVPLVQTGFESYIPYLASERFSKKAKQDGRVVTIVNNIITIAYADGSISTVDCNMVKSRTKRGIYLPNEYNILVNNGQKIKKGQLLAVTNSMKNQKLAIGKNLVVAEMGYMGMNYEDGWVASETLDQKYQNDILQKITIKVPVTSKLLSFNISNNIDTKPGQLLCEFASETNILEQDEIDDDIDSLDQDDTFIGVEQRGKTYTYRSPGGKIRDVVVKLNNKNVQKPILALYKTLVKPLEDKISHCKISTKDDPNKFSECIDHMENSEALTIGGHKVNGVEVDGAIIEIYIEKANPVINGSKFTLASSGGKGTVQYIIPKGQEPIGAESGLKIEFIGTSLSIISRKNPSILLSLYLGKVIYFLNQACKELAKQNKIVPMKRLVLSVFEHIDQTKDKILCQQINTFFDKPQQEILNIVNGSDSLNNPAFPAKMPIFKNKINMENIEQAAKTLDIPLNEKVIVTENNGIQTYKTVPVGILPVHLLEHFPKAMSCTRGSINGKSNYITGQGKSGTKDGAGAISIGLYDANSLLSVQGYDLISELHSFKSDAHKAKKQMINTIIREHRVPTASEIEVETSDLASLNLVQIYFRGAGLEM